MFIKIQKALSLIELMIIVAVIGVLSNASLPAYSQYIQRAAAPDADAEVRRKVIEGLVLAEAVKTVVEQAFRSGGLSALSVAVNEWNAERAFNTGNLYVRSMVIYDSTSTTPGAITITYNTTVIPENDNVMILTPGIGNAALSYSTAGSIDWACTGMSIMTATARGLVMQGGGSVDERYSPDECR